MTTDINHEPRHETAERPLWVGVGIGVIKLLLGFSSSKLGSVVRGHRRAAGWKGNMDRIAFGAILLLALGLWAQPYLTGGSADSTASPALASPARALPTSIKPPLAYSASAPESIPASDVKSIRGNTSFWHATQTNEGVWWFVSPKGKPDFLNTVTTVQPVQKGRDTYGIHYISRDWTASNTTDPGDIDLWAQRTIRRITEMGFKGIGAWSNQIFHKYDVPITRDLNVWSWTAHAASKLYYPEWPAAVETAISTQVAPLKDNVNLVGFFVDNEINWADDGSGPGVYFDTLAATDPNRREVVKVLQRLWPKLDDFNRDWAVSLKDWKELDSWQKLPREQSHAYSKLASAWLSHLAEDYFRITCGYIRKYDQNHLILGVRYRGYAPREVVRASRDYTDVQSINYYVSDGKFDLAMFRMMNEESGNQPVMITEYSFHALDGRSGDRNTVGFAAQVLDQQARADGYRLFTRRAARVPFIVGVDWFQWSDEPPSGRSTDGEDVNFGIVDVDDNAYEKLAAAVKETSPLLNPSHNGSATDAQSDVWRESFAAKPTMHVPYLSKPVYLNGELSDWPAACKLPGVRHSPAIGLERSRLPLPNFYMGWTDEGVYLAMEVFDDDINGAPANGWWWTRDHVELWLATKPPAADQETYDVDSHQFFFVPNAFPGSDGMLGTIGQWHRPGDALKDSVIPQTEIRSATRVLPDRYVVEMLIPSKVLHGYSPRAQPNLAFNLHVRNFQHAIDYFWSAPKEVMTQLRPNTWGQIILDPPGNNSVTAMLPARVVAAASLQAR